MREYICIWRCLFQTVKQHFHKRHVTIRDVFHVSLTWLFKWILDICVLINEDLPFVSYIYICVDYYKSYGDLIHFSMAGLKRVGLHLRCYSFNIKDTALFITGAIVSSKSRAERLVTTRHRLPLPAWVMSERPGGDRGVFVALSVHTSEKLVSSGQKYFSLH